jgi:small subunit ribosomal protein S18
MMPDDTPVTPPVVEAPAPAAPQAPAPARGAGPSGARRRGPFQPRRKVCRFCAEKVHAVDYKQIQILRAFMTERGRILGSRITGNCAKHQRQLTLAIKRARNLSILTF